jgi:hypothetical protein
MTTNKIPMRLRINREGTFRVHADAEHPSQCGATGTKEYRYFASIEATNRNLTSEGFVMENQWVDDYFQDCYGENGAKKLPCDSCENMAQRAIVHFLQMFSVEPELKQIELTRILVRIHGSPVSFIEGEWKSDVTPSL